MYAHSPADLSAYPQLAVPIAQQPDQPMPLIHEVDQLSESPVLLTVAFGIAAIFFCLGIGFGRRQQERRERRAARLQQIQTLERIWQITANRQD